MVSGSVTDQRSGSDDEYDELDYPINDNQSYQCGIRNRMGVDVLLLRKGTFTEKRVLDNISILCVL